MKIFDHKPQKWPQKNKVAGKLELIRKKGFSFRYLWPLIDWNQLKYPMHQPTFFYFVNQCYVCLCIYVFSQAYSETSPLTKSVRHNDIMILYWLLHHLHPGGPHLNHRGIQVNMRILGRHDLQIRTGLSCLPCS